MYDTYLRLAFTTTVAFFRLRCPRQPHQDDQREHREQDAKDEEGNGAEPKRHRP